MTGGPQAPGRGAAGRTLEVVRLLWVAGFLVGTGAHVLDLVAAGTHVYAGFPAPVRVFWVALTVVDPLVVALLLLRRPAGAVLGAAVMVADVAVNVTAHLTLGGGSPPGLVVLTAFGVLVLATAAPLARHLRAGRPGPPTGP